MTRVVEWNGSGWVGYLKRFFLHFLGLVFNLLLSSRFPVDSSRSMDSSRSLASKATRWGSP